MGIWGVQHPHTDVRDQGKRHSKKTTLCPPSALHKMPPRHQIQPQSAKGCPGWHQGAAQHKYKIQESMQSLCCDKRSGLNLPPQLMDPQVHPVTSTLSPRTSGHPCSSYIPKGGPQMPVPKDVKLAPKSLSSPCTANDHHSGPRETRPRSLLGGKWKNDLKRFRACPGSPCLSHGRTGQTCSLPSPLTFDPTHTELSTFFPAPQITPQTLQIRLQASSANADLTSVGLYLQGHFYPGVPSHKHCHPARWLQSLLSEEVKPQAGPLGLFSPHLGNLLTQEAICPSATPPKQSSPNHLTSSKFQCASPSFHAFLFNLSKHSAPNYCDVWGFFF